MKQFEFDAWPDDRRRTILVAWLDSLPRTGWAGPATELGDELAAFADKNWPRYAQPIMPVSRGVTVVLERFAGTVAEAGWRVEFRRTSKARTIVFTKKRKTKCHLGVTAVKKKPTTRGKKKRGLTCPKCGVLTEVLYSRPQDGQTIRRRRCPKCLGRYTSAEKFWNAGSTGRTLEPLSMRDLLQSLRQNVADLEASITIPSTGDHADERADPHRER